MLNICMIHIEMNLNYLKQGIELGRHYPKQIVDHQEKRSQVLATFKALD